MFGSQARRRSRWLPMLSTFALLMMLLGPLAGSATLAGEDPPDEEVVEEQPTEIPPDEAVPTEIPEEVVATEVPTEIPAVAEPSTLTITVYRCNHPDFDTGFSENLQTVLDTCREPGYGTFSIETAIPSSTQSGQSVQFEILGVLAIIESVPTGYDKPIADCYVYDAGGALLDRIGPAETNSGSWRIGGIADGGDVHCDWYQVDRGLGNVYIVNMACPSTAGLFPSPSMDELVTMCTEPAGQGHFLVEHGAGLERLGVSSGEFNDALVEAVQTGPIAIRLSDPVGFDSARVFCQVFDVDQVTQIAPFSEVSVSNFRASGLTLVAGQRIHCSWFNIQEGPGFAQPDGDEPPLDPIEPTQTPGQAPSDLTIRLHTCQPNYDFEAANADPVNDCPEGPDGVTFAIAPVGEPDDSTEGATGDTQPNAVTFPGLAPGDYVVTQDVPNNIGTVFVLGCGGGGGVGPVPQVIDGSLTFGIPQGVIMTCHWFNIRGGGNVVEDAATGESGRIVIQTSVCPTDEVDPSLGIEAVGDVCTERVEGVTFAATADGYEQSGVSSSTGTVMFEEVPPGEATITETIPDGYGDPIVFCSSAPVGDLPSGPLVYEQVTAAGGTIARTVESGIEAKCSWFNVPGVPTEPIEAEAPEGISSITIQKYNCPAGFDVTTVDTNPSATCTTPAAGISFDIDDDADDNAGYYLETGIDGTGTVTGLPAGRYTIEESVRNGTTAVFVWDCYEAGGSSNLTDPIVIGNVVQLDIPNNYQVHCDWYNVVGGASRVVVAKHACDYLVPAYTLSLEELRTQCTIDSGSIDFTVVSDTHQETQPASNNPLTLASFADVPSGHVSVVEDLPDGWAIPIVSCQLFGENGLPIGEPSFMDVVVGRQVSFQVEPGQVMSCDWYNVAQGFVDVHVTKYACPEGVDAYRASLTDLVAGCTDDPGSVAFYLEDGSLYLEERTATAAAPASWTDVPSGELQINEKQQEGYGLPVVWCRIDFEDGSNVRPAQPVSVTNGSNAGYLSIYHDASAGQVLHCEWFNVKGGTGMVSVWKAACPDGFDAHNATRKQLEITCDEPIPPIQFTVISGGFTAYDTSTNTSRYADFYAVPSGPLTVSEQVQTDYDTVVVWCHVQGDAGVTQPEKVEVTGGNTIAWDLKEGDWLICEWYNAHNADGTVVVNKYDCPEGTTPDHDQNWFIDNCTTPHNGIEFLLTHSGGVDPEFTANGTVEWSGVPLGPVSLQEFIPEEYLDPVVYCGVVSSSGGPVDAVARLVPSEGGYVETRFDYPDTRYLCYWYNIPGGPGEIWIEKYTCPEGYDVHAHDADPVKDCPEATNGIRFSLGNEAAGFTATTGEEQDGTAIFREVPYGRWTIAEEIPDGTASVFVLDCTGQRQGELRPTPLSFGGSLEIDLDAGEKITCRWYNVPEDDPDYGRITVIKYSCTTDEFVSDVDCEVEEGGVTIDLAWWNGDDWETVSTRETDGAGRATWTELDEGQYWLDERDGSFCYLASDGLDDDGNWLNVEAGEETVVHVYNCGAEPGKPGKTPIKYPNTGVPPATIPDQATP